MTVAEARRISEAAITPICDHYFVQENGDNSPEEAKSKYRAAFRKGLESEIKWKHLTELVELATRQSTETSMPIGGGVPTVNTFQSSPRDEPNRDSEAEFKADNWDEIKILFFNKFSVQISVGPMKVIREFGSLGLVHKRSGKPTLAWQTLHSLAVSEGVISQPAGIARDWQTVEKRMQEIRAWLRVRFGIHSDPLPFVKKVGYRAKFKIACAPSYQR